MFDEYFDTAQLWPAPGQLCIQEKGKTSLKTQVVSKSGVLGETGRTKTTDVSGVQSMVDVTIVYWRDIPAQVIVGKGRRGSKRQLEERFEQAIDRAAMKVNAKDSDAYLAEWRKAAPYALEGDAGEVAEAEAKRLEAEYDQDRLKTLIANDGWA
jgi:hypothetical protein